MAWSLIGTTSAIITAGAGNQTVTLPGSPLPGDLILVAVAADISCQNSIATAGYQRPENATGANPGAHFGYKFIPQTSPDSSVLIVRNASILKACVVQVWRGGAGAATAYPTPVIGTSTTPDPPAVVTVGADALVVALAFLDDDDSTVTTYPTNYTNGQSGNTGQASATVGATVAIATRVIAAAGSENPGVFTMSSSDAWQAGSIAFRLGLDLSENLKLTDTVSVPPPTLTRTVTAESALVSDVIVNALLTPVPVTVPAEGVRVSDTIAASIMLVVTLTESVQLADQPARDDTILLSDLAVGRLDPVQGSLTDNLRLSDTLAAIFNLEASVSESLLLSETVSVSSTLIQSLVTENLRLSDTVIAAFVADLAVSSSERLLLQDTPTSPEGLRISEVILTALEPLDAVVMGDSLRVSESLQAQLTTINAAPLEGVRISDAVTVARTLEVVLTEHVRISDILTESRTLMLDERVVAFDGNRAVDDFTGSQGFMGGGIGAPGSQPGGLVPGAPPTSSLGSNWTQQSSTHDVIVVDNQAVSDDGTLVSAFWTPTLPADHFSRATLIGVPPLTAVGVTVRMSGVDATVDGYAAYLDTVSGDEFARIVRYDNGVETELASVGVTVVSGSVIELRVYGAILVVSLNGVSLFGEVVDATYSTGSPGILVAGDVAVDDWAGGGAGLTAQLVTSDLALAKAEILAGVDQLTATILDPGSAFLSETLHLTETVQAALVASGTLQATLAESVRLDDTGGKDETLRCVDQIAAAMQAGAADLNASLQEGLRLTGTVSTSVGMSAQLQDDLQLTDTITTRLDPLQTSLQEDLRLSDVVTSGSGLVAQIQEDLRLTDTVVSLLNPLQALVSETFGLRDGPVEATRADAGTLVTNLSETVLLTDTPSLTLDPLQATPIESIRLSDVLTAALDLEATLTENIRLTDTLTVSSGLGSTLQEDLRLSDTLTASMGVGAVIGEALQLSDSVSAAVTPLVTAQTESLQLSDTAAAAFDIQANPSESVRLTDTLTVASDLTASLDETLRLTESSQSILNPLEATRTESLRLSDQDVSATRAEMGGLLVSLTEGLRLTDDVRFFRATVDEDWIVQVPADTWDVLVQNDDWEVLL